MRLLKLFALMVMTLFSLNIFSAESWHDPFKKEDLIAKHFILHYAKAADMANMLQNKMNHLLSERGSVIADARTNSLWIKDTTNRLAEIQNLLKSLDIPSPQILITAKIVNVDENFVNQLGIKLGTLNAHDTDVNTSQLQAGHFTLAIAELDHNQLLEMELNALATEGHANIISNPKLLTGNRQTAIIESGQEIPYQEKTTSGATSVAFKKAALSLKVTPEILSPNKILLNIHLNQDKISSLSINGVPAIDMEQMSTQVEVTDKQTIVLGGLYQENKRILTECIPFLSAIPGLGALFRSKQTITERRELLIFITSSIVSVPFEH